MRPIWCLAAAVMVGVWAFQPRIAAQKEQQIFVSVTAPDGTPVTDLQVGQVSVTEDGVECKIVKLEPVNWPIKLHVLVDNGKPNTNPINSLRDETFYAIVRIVARGEAQELDSRPSDALNLAARVGAQVFIDDEVMANAGIAGDDNRRLLAVLAHLNA